MTTCPTDPISNKLVTLTHGFIPNDLMKTFIVPLIQNKTGNISDKNNYRPIAIVTASSKILEIVLLNRVECFITTSHNQYGFKRKHGTDMCIYTMKNIIEYYRQHGSSVFTCFLDASKAFDRVNFWTIFDKMIKRGIPVIIIRC